MIILPAIDLHQGQCVRLLQGDYATAHVVADSALDTARSFQEQGARWMHMVDLDGAKGGAPQNAQLIFDVLQNVDMHIEVGGGIRDMASVELYLEKGVSRVILGSAALENPAFVKEAVGRYGKKIAVGIDALGGRPGLDGKKREGLSGACQGDGGPGGGVYHLHRHPAGRHDERAEPGNAG